VRIERHSISNESSSVLAYFIIAEWGLWKCAHVDNSTRRLGMLHSIPVSLPFSSLVLMMRTRPQCQLNRRRGVRFVNYTSGNCNVATLFVGTYTERYNVRLELQRSMTYAGSMIREIGDYALFIDQCGQCG